MTSLASDEWRETLQKIILPWAIGARPLGDDMLEIGAGLGLTTDLLRTRVEHMTVVEIEEALAATLGTRLAGTNVSVMHADATALPLPDNRFSSAGCFTMLHHVPTPELQDRLLAEACRVLRPGGILLGTDGVDSDRVRDAHVDDVYNPVDPSTLASRLTQAGFGDVDIEVRENRLRFAAVKPVTE